ncbi:MAG: Uma2 family endonuclease, partial [Chroococcidiopsidaceae cyanobacterium CP_BM_RX_35]|nr:Uma2 family endonuclease [Chroococcidiopsidaceae cyanobacterium CP_BM_RX_35]
MVQYNPLQYLPSAEELPDSDDTPVDNELQIPVAALLRAILSSLWAERQDWFFGVNMGVYYQPPNSCIVPDGFLSLPVVRRKSERGRPSYVLWEENYVAPLLVIEIVSQTPGQEYEDKQAKYAQIGVLYYVVYNPDYWKRDKHEPFEVYRLVEGKYVRQVGEPVWLPEVGLGIARGQGTYEGWNREWLYWYDFEGNRLPSPNERAAQELVQVEQRAAQERQRAEQAEQRAEQAEQQLEQERREREELIARLQLRGINLDDL